MVPFSDSISNSFGTAMISFDLASVGICANTKRCSQPYALTMCRADFSLAWSNERRRTLPSMVTPPWQYGEVSRETLKGGTELRGIEMAK